MEAFSLWLACLEAALNLSLCAGQELHHLIAATTQAHQLSPKASCLVPRDWCHLSQRCQTIPLQASTCWDWELRKPCPLGSLSAGAASEQWIARGPRGPGAAPGARHPLLLQEPQLQVLAGAVGMAGLAGRRDFVRSIKGGQNGAHFQVCLMV